MANVKLRWSRFSLALVDWGYLPQVGDRIETEKTSGGLSIGWQVRERSFAVADGAVTLQVKHDFDDGVYSSVEARKRSREKFEQRLLDAGWVEDAL